MKKIIWILVLFGCNQFGFAQFNSVEFEQIDSLQKVEKRPVLIFIHTSWCKYCKVMQDKTFKNEEVITLLNKKFYFVELTAEEKRKIHFNQNTFSFKPTGTESGINELAIELGTINNEINYPALCILNYKNEIIYQQSGFLNAINLRNILLKI